MRRRRIPGCASVIALLLLAGRPVAAQPDDEEKSASRGGRFLPIPIFITEPAIGAGLGLALAYFHRTSSDESVRSSRVLTPEGISDSRRGSAPPTITGVLGAYTENDTWLGGAGHTRSMWGDRIRYAGVAALAEINSTLYVADVPLSFTLEPTIFFQNAKFRLGSSDFFLGSSFLYLDGESRFDAELPGGGLVTVDDIDSTNGGLALQGLYETLDNTLTPNSGRKLELSVWRYDDVFGGDFDYWDYRLKLHSFHRLGSRVVVGLRLEGTAVDGRPPFYGFPWVQLRGVPALRYQSDEVAVGEIEIRYDFLRRWAIVGFYGAGVVAKDRDFVSEEDILAGGLGGRYLLMQDLGLWVGIDIARGPEETTWYIQAGHAW